MQRIGRYRIQRTIGAGGMGQVYLASHADTGETVALKVIRGVGAVDAAARLRFVQEAGAVQQLRHPSIVAVYEFGQHEGMLYIAIEYLDGQPLSSYIPGPPSLSFVQRLSVIAQCADALQHAHSRGLVHRDVKPANVLVMDGCHAKLLDFGIAASVGQPGAKASSSTPPYMSPEQFSTEGVDARSDIWSLGITLYESLTGWLPYHNFEEVRSAPVPVLGPDAPFHQEMNAILGRALAKDRSMRYPSAAMLAEDLRRIVAQFEASLTPSLSGGSHSGKGEHKATLPLSLTHKMTMLEHSSGSGEKADSYRLSQLGFERPAEGLLVSRISVLRWKEKADRFTHWADLIAVRVRVFIVALWVLLLVPLLAVVALLPRVSDPARKNLQGFGFMGSMALSALMIAGVWLGLQLLIRFCKAMVVGERIAVCQKCERRMRIASFWARICSAEESSFAASDCVAALRHHLWAEAAKLISIYGETSLSKYRERVIPFSARIRLAFYECASCSHHAAHLSAERMVENQWVESPRFNEVYWGPVPVSQAIAAPLFDRKVVPSMLRQFFAFPSTRGVVLTVFCVVLAGGFTWLFLGAPGPRKADRPAVWRVAVSRDGRWLAAARNHGAPALMDLASGSTPAWTIPKMPSIDGGVADLQFSPKADALAVVFNNNISLVDAARLSTRTLRSGSKGYRSARFSPDGRTILTVGSWGILEQIDCATGGSIVRSCCVLGGDAIAVFTPDGDRIVNTGADPGFWIARTGEYVGGLPTLGIRPSFHSIAFEPDRPVMLMGSSTAGIWSWNWKELRFYRGVRAPGFMDVVTMATDGSGTTYFGGSSVEILRPRDKIAVSWEGPKPSSNIVVSPDGASLIFGTARGEVEFWDVRTGRWTRNLPAIP